MVPPFADDGTGGRLPLTVGLAVDTTRSDRAGAFVASRPVVEGVTVAARGVDATGADGTTAVVGADGTVEDGASCCGTVTGAGCCGTGAGKGFGAGIAGVVATGGETLAGAVPGQALPVLPPQTVLDEAIATIISSGRCSAA